MIARGVQWPPATHSQHSYNQFRFFLEYIEDISLIYELSYRALEMAFYFTLFDTLTVSYVTLFKDRTWWFAAIL